MKYKTFSVEESHIKPFFSKTNFCVGDIESPLVDGEFKFRLGVVFDGSNFHTSWSVEDMFYYMDTHKKKNFYFHNLDFDFLFFMRGMSLGSDVTITSSGNMMLSINFKNFKMINSLAILPMGLKKIVRSFLDINWDSWENEKENVLTLKDDVLEEYCRRDCYLTYYAVYKFKTIIKDEYDIKSFLTLPSLAMKIFKKMTDYDYMFNSVNRKNFFESDYYFGGHTEKFVEGVYNFKDLNYYDVNSLYPDIMRNTLFGVGEPTFVNPTMDMLQELIKSDKVFYAEVLVNVDCEELRFFPHREGSKNVYSLGERWYKVSDLTLRYLAEINRLDCLINVRTIVKYVNSEYMFKKFVDTMYVKRSVNDSYNILFKFILNMLYGFFGRSDFVDKVVINSVDLKDFDTVTSYQDNIICRGVEMLQGKQLNYMRKDIAGRVTEGARIKMTRVRNICNSLGVSVVYMDTDSLIVRGDFMEHEALKGYYCNTSLGKFKKENIKPISGVIIGQKIYSLGNESESFMASKGIRNMNKSDYFRLSIYMMMRYCNYVVDDEVRLIDYVSPRNDFYNTRFTKMKSMIRRDFFGITVVPHYINNVTERCDKV